MLKAEVNGSGKFFRKVQGYLDSEDLDWLKLDSASKLDLVIQNPLVEYERLEQDSLVRKIEISLDHMVSDSLIGTFGRMYTDTISRKDFRRVQKDAWPEERGTDPRKFARFWLPAITVFAGVAGIIALFYVRSR